jgi:hypothetical protein
MEAKSHGLRELNRSPLVFRGVALHADGSPNHRGIAHGKFRFLRCDTAFKSAIGTSGQPLFLTRSKDRQRVDITRLPFSIKILLKSALRHCDGYQIREQDVLKVAGWQAHGTRQEIPFKPARLVLQDFTGAPVLKFFLLL